MSDASDYQLIAVGQPLEQFKGCPDGYIVDFDVSGIVVYAILKNPSPKEIVLHHSGHDFEICFAEYGDICFFGFRFGSGFDAVVGDAGFSPYICKDNPVSVDIGRGCGYACNIILIDSATGVVKGVRTVGIGENFSRQWKQWCKDNLMKNLPWMNISKFKRTCEEAYRRKFASPDDIFRMALSSWKTPHGEQHDAVKVEKGIQ